MPTLIQLRRDDEEHTPMIVNLDAMTCMFREGKRTRIYFTGEDKVSVRETLEEIALLLAKPRA